MKAKRKIGWVGGLVAILFMGLPAVVHADWGEILSKFQPYITLQEEYSSNIFLTETGKIDDYITTVSPGLRFSTLPRIPTTGGFQRVPTPEDRFGMDLDIRAGFVFYAKEEDNKYISLNGTLNAWVALTQGLTFRIRDYVIRSDAAREPVYSGDAPPDQFLLSTVRGQQAIYVRNVVEPSVEYRFGRENVFSILYRNNTYEVQNIAGQMFEDSQENTINPRVTYWFDIRNGITLDYSLTFGHYERSPDDLSHGVRARYTHRWNPRFSIFGEYSYLNRSFESPGIDYDIHNPSLGVEYRFSPTLVGTVQGGYFWQNPDQGSKTRGPSVNLGLTKTGERTIYTLTFVGGYTEDYFTAENRGFARYYRVYGTVNHRLTEQMSVGLTGSLERATFRGNGEKDWTWGVSGNASYQLFRWLGLSLIVSHRENHSNIDNLDYSEYRGIFRVTATYN